MIEDAESSPPGRARSRRGESGSRAMSTSDQARLTVPCSHCGAPVTGDLRYCSACGGALVLEPEPRAPEPPQPPPEGWRPQGQQWIVAAGAILVLLLFGGVLALEIRGDGGPETNQALTRPRLGAALGERFVVSDWRAVDGVLGVVILGEVRNENAVAAGVQLQIIAYDAAGSVVDTLEYWPAAERNIAPGATASIDVVATRRPAVTFEVRIIDARVW
jgi:hypothetical protein